MNNLLKLKASSFQNDNEKEGIKEQAKDKVVCGIGTEGRKRNGQRKVRKNEVALTFQLTHVFNHFGLRLGLLLTYY